MRKLLKGKKKIFRFITLGIIFAIFFSVMHVYAALVGGGGGSSSPDNIRILVYKDPGFSGDWATF